MRAFALFVVGFTIGGALAYGARRASASLPGTAPPGMVDVRTRPDAPPHYIPTGRFVLASAEGMLGYPDACGGIVDANTLGAASPSLPCGWRITVRFGSRSVHVRVTDHGPYIRGRVLDLWRATIRALGGGSDASWGVRRVRVLRGWR